MDQDYIQPDPLRVFVGICGERFDIPEFGQSKDDALFTTPVTITEIHTARGHRVDRNRDKIVRRFLASDKDPQYLLFLDSDMTFPADLVQRLISWDLPVVGGLYFHRGTDRPFVFREVGYRKDEWGREIRFHQYMMTEVYEFLHAANLPLRNQAVAVNAPNRLLQCDAIGTGAMLIHRDVIEAIDGPWFEYDKHAESEDLAFCRKAREAGFDVHCDLGTICGHLRFVAGGYAEFMKTYAGRGIYTTNYNYEEGVRMVAHCLDIEPGEAAELIGEYHPRELAELWYDMEFAEGGNLRPIDFYQSHETGKLYIPELVRWNASPTFAYFREQLVGVEDARVLEIGSGIGSMAIQLCAQGCDVDAYEANQELIDFAKKRFKMLEDQDRFFGHSGSIYWHGPFKPGRKLPATAGAYDLVVAVDVLEHMDEETLRKVMGYIAMYLKLGGKLYAHVAWGDHTTEKVHPFHYDHSAIWPDILKENGLFEMSDLWYLKVGSKIE